MNNYTISELKDYSLRFKYESYTPNIICLYKEDNFVGSVRRHIRRDGSNYYTIHHDLEGFRHSLDSRYTLRDAENHLVQFHIKNYER